MSFAQQQMKTPYLLPPPSILAKIDPYIETVCNFFFLPCFLKEKINGIFEYFQTALILSSHKVVYMTSPDDQIFRYRACELSIKINELLSFSSKIVQVTAKLTCI